MSARTKYENIEINVPLFPVANNRFDRVGVCELLEQANFSTIEIPIYSYFSILTDNITRKGKAIVGFVKSYDPDKQEFVCEIFEVYKNAILDFKHPIIYPRTENVQGNPIKINGLDICPAMYYANTR